MPRSILNWLLLSGLALVAAGLSARPATAQTEMLKDVIGAGGGRCGNGTHAVAMTLGQTCTGRMTTASYHHHVGFWGPLISSFSTIGQEEPLPRAARLEQNYPNPFHLTTAIRFDLPDARHVRMEIYAIDGRRVAELADQAMGAGRLTLTWDGRDTAGHLLPSGAYFYRLTAGDFQAQRRVLLLR